MPKRFKVPTLVFIVSLSFGASFASAATQCADLLKSIEHQSAAVRAFVISDAYVQWLLWEQRANLAKFQKPTSAVDVPLVEIPASEVSLVASEKAPPELLKAFVPGDGKAFWVKHPYNRWKGVPYYESAAQSTMPVYMTSSRSMALSERLRGFTLKVATDHPHGPDREWQPMKVNIKDDIDSAMLNSGLLEIADREMGEDPMLIMLGEVMTLADKETGYGMVIRDVRRLDDGNYYLPAFAIPYVGHRIAELNGKSFDEFFGENYAALLGEAKARLLLRTGLQMLTPNPQNMLIQLDRNLRPTGKIVFRDISDAYLVDVVASGLGHEDQIAKNTAAGYMPKSQIKPAWRKSAWRLNRSTFLTRLLPWGAADKDSNAASVATVQAWGRLHDQSYVRHIERELGVNIGLDPNAAAADEMPLVYNFLKSALGQTKLREYRARKIREASRG